MVILIQQFVNFGFNHQIQCTPTLTVAIIVLVKLPWLASKQMVVSHAAKKKQQVCASLGLRDYYIELFTRMTAPNF